MFDMVSIRKDEKNNIITIRGLFGNRFSRGLEKNLLKKNRLKQLFVGYSALEISFHEFFALEVRNLLLDFLDLPFRKNAVTIQNAIDAIVENTWLGDMDREFPDNFDYSILKEKMTYDILPHQKEWFAEYNSAKKRRHYRGRLLAAGAGLGKTYMSLSLAELLKSKKIVVLCPLPSLEKVWINSVKNELYNKPETLYTSLDKGKYNDERIIVYHYESMSKLGKIIPFIKGKDTTVIIDESHNLNEEDSKRTQLMVGICKAIGTDNIMLLSGSPIKAMPLEMLPMIEVLDKGFNTIIKNRFKKLYKSMPKTLKRSIQERYSGYRTYIPKSAVDLPPVITENISIKLKNAKEYTLDTIRKKMKEYATTRIKELKEKYLEYLQTYTTLYNKAKDDLTYNKMSEKDFLIYEKTIKDIKSAYADNRLAFIGDKIKYANKFEQEILIPMLDPEEKKLFREAKTIVKYLKLKVQGEILGLIVGRERINCHMDLAKVVNYKSLINTTTKKTIIFSNYVDVCETAYQKTSKIGYHPLKVYGKDTKYLAETVSNFMVKDNEQNPLVTTYKSLSTAVPLTVANVAIFMDMPFRSYIYDQAIARLHRIGQDKNTYAYQVHLDTGDIPNINSRNIDIIEWSKNMVEEITGATTELTIIRNEGTDEGRMTVELNNLLDVHFLGNVKKKIGLEEIKKEEECITDAW